MAEKEEPIFKFEGLKQLLKSMGYQIEKALDIGLLRIKMLT